MSELKLCSYCKSVPQANTWTLHGISETRYFCPNPECPHSVRTVTLEQWNTRPIEDELRKRIAELEAENDELKERVAMLDVTAVFKSLGEMRYIEQVATLNARIAELEEFIGKLIEAGGTMAKGYRSHLYVDELQPINDWKKLEKDWKEREE